MQTKRIEGIREYCLEDHHGTPACHQHAHDYEGRTGGSGRQQKGTLDGRHSRAYPAFCMTDEGKKEHAVKKGDEEGEKEKKKEGMEE